MVRFRFLVLFAVLGALAAHGWGEEVTFTYLPVEGEEVQSISVRGDFNGWGETPMLQQPDGSWSVTVDLDPGRQAYKFFLNGQWPKDMSADRDGGPMDSGADDYVDDTYGGQNAVRIVGGAQKDRELPPAGPRKEGHVRIHYHRPDGLYSGWGLHAWEDADVQVTWTSPLPPDGEDDYGLFWDVKLKKDAQKVGFIVHRGDEKDPGPDMLLLLGEHGEEVWLVTGSATIHTERPDVASLAFGDLGRMKAHWLDRGTIAWRMDRSEGNVYRLHHSPEADLEITADGVLGGEQLTLTLDRSGLSRETRARFPHLAGYSALRLPPMEPEEVQAVLKGQLAVSVTGEDGALQDATGVQIPGVLDDLFAYDGPLGVTWEEGAPTLRLWAPTARSVRVHLFDSTGAPDATEILDMNECGGVWTLAGKPEWKGRAFNYEVEVFMPATGRVERNMVTDPYSRGLSMNSRRTLLVDMDDPSLKPEGWDDIAKPALDAPEDIVLYELHVRDFSATDPGVPEEQRGTFLAFTADGNGARHLKALADAGLTHIHLLPAFDIATIDEEKSHWKSPGDLSAYPPDSEEQQKVLSAIKDDDGYNWGYDPFHFGVPEGSYSTDPDGPARILEFREMVQALAGMGLRVVMDVVYNHTNASGRADKSVFDKIVPGYYHRLDKDGVVATSTCCQNTATEHTMMERFMIDDLVHWAVDYKVDGFRFDLMGHHMKANMEKALHTLRGLTVAKHGVDGSNIYLYGEGWNFGEVANNARGVNATQENMARTGIGTFNDRIRDAVRGGSPFGDLREQGFATGLYYDPNGFQRGGDQEKGRLIESADRIRAGLAGNLRDYHFTAGSGGVTRGSSVGAYTADPEETINYASAHDNQTLFDKIAFAAPAGASAADRARMQNMALSIVALGQGIPFFHAGSDMLRSKSLDGDSYNSGDWFNRLDFTYETNNFGVGLPPAEKNRDRWGQMRPLLANPGIQPGREEILRTVNHFQEMLRIRKSSPLFRLRDAQAIMARVAFHNTGPGQIPGLVVMSIDDEVEGLPGVDDRLRRIVVLFNATTKEQCFGKKEWKEAAFELHPVQADSADPVVRGSSFDAEKGKFCVPPRTTSVFVEE